MVDGAADALEASGANIYWISRSVFAPTSPVSKRDGPGSGRLRHALTSVGNVGDKVSLIRDMLLGIGRIAAFSSDVGRDWMAADLVSRLSAVNRDVLSLNDYEVYLASKIQFLLEAILGYISIQQNDIFRILTVASVAAIPPTVLAGICGMNFKNMPELRWTFGYHLAWLAILLSTIMPLIWFKRKAASELSPSNRRYRSAVPAVIQERQT